MRSNVDSPARVFICAGSYPRRFARNYDGAVLMFDTEAAVLQDDAPDRHAVHLQPDLRRPALPDVPTRHARGAGLDGAALDSSFALRTLTSDPEAFERLVDGTVQRAEMVHMFFSRGGGTGNGVFGPILSWVATEHRQARIVLITALDPSVNPIKQANFLRDHLRGLPESVISVVARESQTIEEVMAIQPGTWATIAGIRRNIPGVAADSDFRVMQVRRVVLSESEIIDGVVEGVLRREVPRRWHAGATYVGQQEVKRAVGEIQDVLTDLERRTLVTDIPIRAVVTAARRGARTLLEVADEVIARAASAVQAEIDADLAYLEERIPRVGLDHVPEFEPVVARWEQRAANLNEETGSDDWDTTLRSAVRSQSFVSRIKASVSGRGGDHHLHAVAALARRAVEHENTAYVARRLRDMRTPPLDARSDTRVLHLRPGSALSRSLEDAYFGARDGARRLHALRQAVRERLPEIIVEALAPELPELVGFDFQTTFESRGRTGLVVSSRFGAQLAGLAHGLHIDPMHLAVPKVDVEQVEIVCFGTVQRIRDVPAFVELAEKFNHVSDTATDRRLFLCRARDIFPPKIRDTRGTTPDAAALVIAKAAAVPGLLRIAHGDGVDLALRGAGMATTNFDRFDAFVSAIMPLAEIALHDGFWAYFANNRNRCSAEVDALAAREAGRHEASRLVALERFVGTKRWQRAVTRLAEQVKVANGCWE